MTGKAAHRCFKVLVVEDHPVAARGIADTLEAAGHFEVVGIAETEAGAVRLAGEHRPDLATVDMTLGKGTGLGVIRALIDEHPELRVLVYSMHDEMLYAERAMRAGAHGYLNKTARAHELVEAARTVAAGGLALSDDMNDRLVKQALGSEEGCNGVAGLSDREIEVFELIGHGEPLKRIAERLGISIKTVETHRENIKKKLDLDSATALARYAVAWVENPA